jgi:hypothetical protein
MEATYRIGDKVIAPDWPELGIGTVMYENSIVQGIYRVQFARQSYDMDTIELRPAS